MTENYRVCALYSGSGGNSLFIDAAGVKILIDAGKNARALCRALSRIGSDISEITAIFITHEHTDHVSALEIISKRHEIPIHILDRSAERFDRDPDAYVHKNLVRHGGTFSVELDGVRVSCFKTPHDSRGSVGYRVDICRGGEERSIGVATDIGYVTRGICSALEGCETVVLESNHDEEMLMEGRYPYELKTRILSNKGHLSNKASARFGAHLAEKGTKAFLLAHLSEENNRPEVAYDEFVSAIGDGSVSVFVADPEEPTEVRIEEEESYAFGEDNIGGQP